MNNNFQVTRAHLKNACEKKQWDLLDKLLEIDNSCVNDNSMFTDSWGLWWSMLLDCVLQNREKGVRVLLKHGADPKLESWGDGMTMTPIEAAENKPPIRHLLLSPDPVQYVRQSDPELPQSESARDRRINHQGNVRDQTGLVFPVDDE